MCIVVLSGACRIQNRVLDPLELQITGSHHVVVRLRPRYSEITAHVPNQ